MDNTITNIIIVNSIIIFLNCQHRRGYNCHIDRELFGRDSEPRHSQSHGSTMQQLQCRG
jgi:hypothetical protein